MNAPAVAMGSDLNAGVPFYGRAAKTEDVPKIRAALLINYVEDDKRVNATRPDHEAALKSEQRDLRDAHLP